MLIKRFLAVTGIGLATVGVLLVTSGAAAPQAPVVEFRAPPEGWNPVAASDSELDYYNFPPRPRNPEDLARWKSVVTNTKWVRPEFRLTEPRMGSSRGEIVSIDQNK